MPKNRRIAVCFWLGVLGWLFPAVGDLRAADVSETQTAVPARPENAGRRIVAFFDFDEQKYGNYEPVPMYWRRHVAQGFPNYLEGRFDEQVGHDGSPSFRLDLNGGSLAYTYLGQRWGHGITVRTASDYLISSWIRVKGLNSARAYMSACYLDRKGEIIAGTERRSPLIGGPGVVEEQWQRVTIALPGNVPGSRYIAITLWLTQAREWNTSQRSIRSVEQEDVNASAWFDDIHVYRLPRVSLRADSTGNVFDDMGRATLLTEVSDPDGGQASDQDGLRLRADLMLFGPAGQLVDSRQVPIHTDNVSHSDSNVYTALEPGVYRAELQVSAGGIPLVTRVMQFACLMPWVSPPGAAGRNWGVVLEEVDQELLEGQKALLQQIRPEFVKVPVWCAERAVAGRDYDKDAVDAYVEAVVESYADPIAVMRDQPRRAGPSKPAVLKSMIDLFHEDPTAWKPLITATWSRYAGLAHVWQLGGDGEAHISADSRVGEILPLFREQMQELMSNPLLSVTSVATYRSDPQRLGDYDTIMIPSSVQPRDIHRYLGPILKNQPQRAWVTIEPPDEPLYPRAMRFADLSKRLVETSYLNPGGVFLQAPWDGRIGLLDAQVNPREDYIIFRTIADVLGGTVPLARTQIDGRAECLLFDRNGLAICFVWDDHAPPEGADHLLYLGKDAEQVDLWGRRFPLETVGSRQKVRIGPLPTFIVRTSTWLMEFRRNFRVDPSLLEASFDKRECEVVFRNTYHEPISGLVRLTPPDGWEIRPYKISFSLQPGEELRRQLDVHFPLNAEAGIKAILADFTLDADRRYRLRVPGWFELGLKDIDLDTYVFRAGEQLVVRMSLANRTDNPVSFEGFVVAPRRQRMSRPFLNFLPGQSTTKDFILENAADLRGKYIRVGFKEIEGDYRVWNRLIMVP